VAQQRWASLRGHSMAVIRGRIFACNVSGRPTSTGVALGGRAVWPGPESLHCHLIRRFVALSRIGKRSLHCHSFCCVASQPYIATV
jgi:hypothetical protein